MSGFWAQGHGPVLPAPLASITQGSTGTPEAAETGAGGAGSRTGRAEVQDRTSHDGRPGGPDRAAGGAEEREEGKRTISDMFALLAFPAIELITQLARFYKKELAIPLAIVMLTLAGGGVLFASANTNGWASNLL
jgi:hypothetical protein